MTELTSDISFDKIYSNEKEKFLLQGYDESTEHNAKIYLVDSALDYFIKEDLVIKGLSIKQNKDVYQITHKGFLRLSFGFVQEQNLKIKELNKKEQQRNFDNWVKVLSPIVGFILGLISSFVSTKYL